jgi:Ferredoxin-like domain in Api92-like protein
MPNWCSNELTVTGRGLQKFAQYVEDIEFDFNKIRPMPIVLRMFNEFGRHTGKWYNWCISHWGTKWTAEVCGSSKRRGKFTISFDTAWAPATGVVERLSQKYPDLTFELYYEESGCCFAGTKIWKAGEVIGDIDQSKELEERCLKEMEEAENDSSNQP